MKMIPSPRIEMVAKIQDAHHKALGLLAEKFPIQAEKLKILNTLQVELSERLATKGGDAQVNRVCGVIFKMKIRVNARLHAIHSENLVPTYLHELAHIVATVIHGRQVGHGWQWAQIMSLFGLPADRCHTMDVTALQRQVTRYDYKCAKCAREFKLTPYKHKAQQERGRYRCKCGGELLLLA